MAKESTAELLDKANLRLKESRSGIAIIQRGGKLSLRGTLPDRYGDGKKQQTIALDIYCNPAGVKRAELEARKLSTAIALKEFDWNDWGKPTGDRRTIGEIRAQFEKDFYGKRGKTGKTENTYKTGYNVVFNALPQDAIISSGLLKEAILSTEPNTRNRRRYCSFTKTIAKFTGLELDFDVSELRGSYSIKRVNPRDLPSDEDIAAFYKTIPHEGWQYVFGLMACYGLRNHECFNLDLESLKYSPILQVIDGKTGPRRIWPCYPEWYDRWRLFDVDRLPEVKKQSDNSRYGQAVWQALSRYGFNHPYNLRHAWAVRTMEFGLDIALASAQMGHSVKIHTEVYFHWISDRVHQRAFDLLMARTDRPIAPL